MAETRAGGAGGEQLRRRNAASALRSLRVEGPASRAELAVRLGLAKATAGAIVSDLAAAGAVTEIEQVRSGERGRPGRRVTLAGSRQVGLGLEANVEYVASVVLDLSGETRTRAVRPVARPRDVAAALGALFDETVAEVRASGLAPVGCTVAIPGLIAGDDRTIAWTPNLDLAGTGVAESLGSTYPGLRLSNDADCAAIAELQHGAAVGVRHLLYLTGTVGIGAGVVVDGRLVRGARGFAGEVGHLPIGEPDAPCGCGRTGCWEASVGLHAMLAATGMPESGTPEETARAVAGRAAGDRSVSVALERLGDRLGRGLAVLSGVLDLEVIVLGGYFAALGPTVMEPARAALDAGLGAAQGRPELRPGTLGTEAAALGAAERALSEVYEGRVDVAWLR